MTVSEIVSVLKDAKRVALSWNGTTHDLDLCDPVMLSAFGDNVIANVYALGEDDFELALAVRPLKRGETM